MLIWLSSFLLNPALAVGSLAVASPILIHLLSRRRFQRIRWAAMSFLLEAQKQNRRRIRLQQMILLALRCLAVMLIAMAVARPFVSDSSFGGAFAERGRTEHFVLLDDSYSMGYRDTGGQSMDRGGDSVFARACDAVRQLAHRLSEESPRDALSVYLTSEPHRALASAGDLSPPQVRRLDDAMEGLSPTQVTARFDHAIAAMCETIRNSSAKANAAVYIVSDFQRSDWTDATPGPQSSVAAVRTLPAAEPLVALCETRPDLQVSLVDVAADTPSNLAVTNLWVSQSRVASGVPTRVEVEVANYSPEAREQVVLAVESADHILPPITLPRIEAHAVVHVPTEVTFAGNGPDFVRVRLAGIADGQDGLALDNTRAAAVDVLPSIRVLLVNGEADSDPFRDEVYLLRTALRPEGRVSSGFDVIAVTPPELEAVEWDAYSAVILANVGRISLAARQGLERYVQDGGGLVVFTGDMIDRDYYNRELHRDGAGLLSVELLDEVAAPVSGNPFHVGDWEESHPLMRNFTDALAATLRQVRVTTFTGVRLLPGNAAVNSNNRAGESPMSPPAAHTVIARYDDPARSPAIIESRIGRGRVLLFTTSADQEWNDWASNLCYVPMVLEMMSYVAHPGTAAGPFTVGEPMAFRLEPSRVRSQAKLRPPNYPVDPETTLPDARIEDGRLVFRYESARRVGLWSLEAVSTQGAPMRIYLPANPAASESDLTRVGQRTLEASFVSSRVRYVRHQEAEYAYAATPRRELWWPMLLMAVVVLMAEHALAWMFGARSM